MSTITFAPAVREQLFARVALFGPSGSGKTYTSLLFAQELAGDAPVAVIDTEHGRSRLYADVFPHLLYELRPPHHPEHYIKALRAAADAKVGAVVMDSITHEWDGEGGVKEIVDNAKSQFGGNAHSAWSVGTPLHNKFVESILAAPLHIICTMRSKVEWVIEQDDRGRNVPRKVGLGPVQRDSIEYEFDVCMLMDTDNNGTITKTHAGDIFPIGQIIEKPGKEFAAELRAWLGSGDRPRRPDIDPMYPETAEELNEAIASMQRDHGDHESGIPWSDRIATRTVETFGRPIEQLTEEEARKVIRSIQSTREQLQPVAAS